MVRQTTNGKNHKFKADLILAIHNMLEKNQKRWDIAKEKYYGK